MNKNLTKELNEKAGKELTQREKEVLLLIVEGKTNNQIAEILSISYYTAKAHVCSILRKMNVEDRLCAAIKAIRANMV